MFGAFLVTVYGTVQLTSLMIFVVYICTTAALIAVLLVYTLVEFVCFVNKRGLETSKCFVIFIEKYLLFIVETRCTLLCNTVILIVKLKICGFQTKESCPFVLEM